MTALEAAVREGRLAPGERLPTVRGLAKDLRLSPVTVSAAYGALNRRGLLLTEGRLGTRVNPRPPIVPAPAGGRGGRRASRPRHRQSRPRSPAPPWARPAWPRREAAALRLPPGIRRSWPWPARTWPVTDATHAMAIVGGAMDGIERVLQAHLQPGDRVAVEDPGYTAVLDLLGALGLRPEPVPLDTSGCNRGRSHPRCDGERKACLVTPRAQNPTGAALSADRARDLRAVLAKHPEVLVVEDDHAGPVAGAAAVTDGSRSAPSMGGGALGVEVAGPDLRVGFLAGDEATVSRVEGRQALGSGWVSHILQETVVRLWKAPENVKRLQDAARIYEDRRLALLRAVRRRFLKAEGRSGLQRLDQRSRGSLGGGGPGRARLGRARGRAVSPGEPARDPRHHREPEGRPGRSASPSTSWPCSAREGVSPLPDLALRPRRCGAWSRNLCDTAARMRKPVLTSRLRVSAPPCSRNTRPWPRSTGRSTSARASRTSTARSS